VIKIEDKKPLENMDPKKQIEISIKLPKNIVNIIEKLGKWSGKSTEKIIFRFIFCELEILTDDYDSLGEYFESFIEEITDCLHDFNINYDLGYET